MRRYKKRENSFIKNLIFPAVMLAVIIISIIFTVKISSDYNKNLKINSDALALTSAETASREAEYMSLKDEFLKLSKENSELSAELGKLKK